MAHILVVDDEKSICELLEITFRKEGHRVEVVHNVEGAKRKLESSLYDIIISDVRMPGATGLELLKLTREIAPDSYFVLITGVPTLETAIAAANQGANRYVIKDHDLVDQLRAAVREVSENLKWKKEAGYLRRGIAAADGAGQHRRTESQDASYLRSDSDDSAAEQSRADHRRERDGKGVGGARDSREQSARRRLRLSPSIAERFRKHFWNPNCSAT